MTFYHILSQLRLKLLRRSLQETNNNPLTLSFMHDECDKHLYRSVVNFNKRLKNNKKTRVIIIVYLIYFLSLDFVGLVKNNIDYLQK